MASPWRWELSCAMLSLSHTVVSKFDYYILASNDPSHMMSFHMMSFHICMMSFHMMSLHMCTLISDVQAVWCVKFSMISLCPYPPFLLDSTIISQYPTSSEYPRFYELGGLLRGMVEDSLKIHPYTREMLAAIDRCVTTSSCRHLTVKLHTTPFSPLQNNYDVTV